MPFSSASVYRYNPRQQREHATIETCKTALMSTGAPVSPIKSSGEIAATTPGIRDPNLQRRNIPLGQPWHNAPGKGSCRACGFTNRPESVYNKRYDREGHVHASHSGVIRQDMIRMALAHKVAAGEIPSETAKAMESSHYHFDRGFKPQKKATKPQEVTMYETMKMNNSANFGTSTERRMYRTLHEDDVRPPSELATSTGLFAHSIKKDAKAKDDDEAEVCGDEYWDGVQCLRYNPSGTSALHYKTGEFKYVQPPLHHNRKFNMSQWEDEKREIERKREEAAKLRQALPSPQSKKKQDPKWNSQVQQVRENAQRTSRLRQHRLD